MTTPTCPLCGDEMVARLRGDAQVSRCPQGHGVFLARADLGALVEAESDWHRRTVQDTAQLPRITGEMTSPPVAPARARAWVETLFD